MLKPLIGGLLLAASAACCAANPWADLAKADLDFAYQSIRANHPGAIDDANPYFREWMEKGYAQASADAAKVASLPEAQLLLRRYFAGFADGHLALGFTYQARTIRWAGMVLRREGRRYRVAASQEPAVPAGAELLSCDGRNIDSIIEQDLLPNYFNNRELDWLKTSLAEEVLTVQEMQAHPEYARCSFAIKGQARDVALTWRTMRRVAYIALAEKNEPDLGKDSTIKEIKPGHFWVHLPQFQPNDQHVVQLKELTARMPALRRAKLIVFDIRGNNGGDSSWGSRMLDALYGADYMRQQNRDHGYALWRASEGNLRYLQEGIVPRMVRQLGEGHPSIAEWRSLAERMRAAMAQGRHFVKQDADHEQPPAAAATATTAPVAPLTRARIALVTQSGCASSCLDFADAVLSIPGAVHLGETTGADTVYMDVRREPLPSGLGGFIVSQKVYRDRLRAHNAAYTPHKPYEGNIHDTAKLQAWVLQQLGR